MDKLKLQLLKKKEQVGTSFSRAQIEQKRVEAYKQTEEKAELERQKKLQQKLKYIDEFCEPKKKSKAEAILESEQVPKIIYQKQEKQEKQGQKQKEKGQSENKEEGREQEDKIEGRGDGDDEQQQRQKPENDEVLNKKIRDEKEYEELEGRLRYLLIQPKLLEEPSYRAKKLKMIESYKQKEALLSDKCDQIILWCRKILRVWLETLELKYNTQQSKKQKESLKAYSLYKETHQHLQPLFIVLRARSGDLEMIESIYHIMNCSLLRDYREANDRYIEMSIGNAPWPVGAIMLGITVRRNTPRLAHVLKDPVSRRWTQSIKRLLTVSQELYPNSDNTKMVLYSVASIFGD